MLDSSDSIKSKSQNVIDIALRLALLFLLVSWCFQILYPFVSPLMWGIIIAISVSGIFATIKKWMRGKTGLAATVYVLLFLGILLVPTYFLMESMVGGLADFGEDLSEGNFKVPPANADVKDWPLIGDSFYAAWNLASTNLDAAIDVYQPQLKSLGASLIESIVGLGSAILLLAFSIIISGVLLAYASEGGTFTRKLFKRAMGEQGEEFLQISEVTIKNVTKGVLGVALIQSLLVGIGLLLSGVPYAGLWALIVLVLAIIQLPASIVTIPAIIYLFTALSPLGATLWAIYLFAAGASDNVLKPILLGKGAPVPMMVIFLGSIGGFITSGFIGLFIGAIVLSIGYKLLISWIEQNETENLDAKN